MFKNRLIYDDIYKARIIVVLSIDRVEDAIPTATTLMDNGINVIELTLRTPVALDALEAIKINLPEMIVGIGTVLKPSQIDEIVDKGASFGVSPGLNPKVVEAAL